MTNGKILSGFTSDVPKNSRLGFFFGLGTPATTIYLSSLGAPPFDSNEYIAVVARKGLLIPGNVALAYRLLGLKGPAESAGLASAILFLVVGCMGAINLVALPHPTGGSPYRVLGRSRPRRNECL